MARNTIGGAVATVKGARITAYVKNAGTAKFNFNVHSPRQFDDDNDSTDDSLTFQELQQAKHLYNQHMKAMKAKTVYFVITASRRDT
jgi:hypothetical protein